jgi:hypothetical protein
MIEDRREAKEKRNHERGSREISNFRNARLDQPERGID